MVLSVACFRSDGIHVHRLCFHGSSICLEHWGVWIALPASFWSGVAALSLTSRISSFQAVAFDLNCLVALASFFTSLLLAWRSTQGDMYHGVLAVCMQAQVAACVRGAHTARRRCSNGLCPPPNLRRQQSRSLPRGWRCREDSSGRLYFEHKRSGLRQWDLPGSPRGCGPMLSTASGSASLAPLPHGDAIGAPPAASHEDSEWQEDSPKSPRRGPLGVYRSRGSAQRRSAVDLRTIFEPNSPTANEMESGRGSNSSE